MPVRSQDVARLPACELASARRLRCTEFASLLAAGSARCGIGVSVTVDRGRHAAAVRSRQRRRRLLLPPPSDRPPDTAGSRTGARLRRPAMSGAIPASLCHTDQEASLKGTQTRAGEESAVAGGGQRVRELPRPRAGARRRRRQGAHPEVRRDEAGGGQRDLSHLPQPRHARRLGRQHARPRATCRARRATACTARSRRSTSW